VLPTLNPLKLSPHLQVVAVLLSLVAGAILLLFLSGWLRRRSLRKKRAGVTQERFTAFLQQYGFDPVITSSTYRYLQEIQMVGFPILPSDALDRDLGLDADEIDQTLRDLSSALHREYSPGLMYTPLITVEDLVRLLQAFPRTSRSSAA
jgi:hypothetical protein